MGQTAFPYQSVRGLPSKTLAGRNSATAGPLQTISWAAASTGDVLTVQGDGTVAFAAVSAGISSLNGLTTGTQTFAVGTTGTDIAFVSAAGVHTLNIPDASATARGAVTTGTQSFTGVKSFVSQEIRLSSDAGTGLRIRRNGDLLQIENNAASHSGYIILQSNTSTGIAVRGTAWGTTLQVTRGIDISTSASGGFGCTLACASRGILEQWDNESTSQAQTYRVYNVRTSDTSFERLNIAWASNVCTIEVTAGAAGGTLRGLRIGGAITSLLGFYGATPVNQPDTIADPTGGLTTDTEARTAINAIIDRLQELGLIA